MTVDAISREPLGPTEPGDDELDAYDPNELVGSAEIARRLGVKPRTVTIWTQRPATGFPKPDVASGRHKWAWGRVLVWHRHRLATLAAGPRERALGHEDRVAELGWTGPGGKRAESLSKADLALIARMKNELVEVQSRLDEGEGVTSKTISDIERSLAKARDQLARRADDTTRRAELFSALHDAGVSWDAIGAFIGTTGYGVRAAVRNMKKRAGP